MPRKAMPIIAESNNRETNFQQIVGLAEKLVQSVNKRIQQAEDNLK